MRSAAMTGRLNKNLREGIDGYLFIAPWLIGFLGLVLGPMLASLYYSFTEYSITRPAVFVGLDNYRTALTGDNLFWHSMARTARWTVTTVPLGILGSLLAAILLNQKLAGSRIYRTLFYLPSLTPIVAASYVWRWMFNADAGVVNWLLELVTIQGPSWLQSTVWAFWVLVIIELWTVVGGSQMLIFLAGLQGIPQELYEAAEIDGAGSVRKTLSVTVPLMTPTIFFNMVLGFLTSLQVFTSAFLVTEGGPAYATYFFALHIYSHAFLYFNMGYACTVSWFLFLVVVSITVLQFVVSKHWVFYEASR